MIKEDGKHRILTSSEKSCIIIATGVVQTQATPAKEQKNSTFFKAVKERKLGQLANEPSENMFLSLACNGVRLYKELIF